MLLSSHTKKKRCTEADVMGTCLYMYYICICLVSMTHVKEDGELEEVRQYERHAQGDPQLKNNLSGFNNSRYTVLQARLTNDKAKSLTVCKNVLQNIAT